jgi:putative transposase
LVLPVVLIELPRDRDSSCQPQLVKTQQTRFTGMDDKILFLYAQGMTTHEICTAFKALYDVDVSASPPAGSGVPYRLLRLHGG